MNDQYMMPGDDSPALLKGVLWALATATTLVVFYLLIWLGALRTQSAWDRNLRINAERERDWASQERNTAIQECNERLGKAEAARVDAVSKEQTALDAKSKAEEQRDESEREIAYLKGTRNAPAEMQAPVTPSEPPAAQAAPAASVAQAVVPPSTADIVNFIRGHLERMTGSVEGQLADYADEVDFHDMPRASLQAIGADRERWAQHWPRRVILANQVAPEVSVIDDPIYGWQATAVFNWRWYFWSRTGAVAQGVYRDTWKIVPAGQSMKIISEHSLDAVTGRSRD